MKKKILIGIGVIAGLLIIGTWVYLFFSGTKSGKSGTFYNFGIFNSAEEREVPSVGKEPTVDVSKEDAFGAQQALRKLTMRRVAGAVFTETGIRYAERGTGYIYDINFETGKETTTANITIPRTTDAVFSPHGNRVALIANDATQTYTFVGTITKDDNGLGEIDGVDLPPNAQNVVFSDEGDIIKYFLPSITGGVGYAYNIVADTTTALFAIPLSHVEIVWADLATYAYTTPSAKHAGYLYEIVDNELQRIEIEQPGLMATAYDMGLIVTRLNEQGELDSHAITHEDELVQLPFALLPEKCTGHKLLAIVYCAAPSSYGNATYPDDWYKGVVSTSDILWRFNMTTSEAERLINPEIVTRQEIDVVTIGNSANGQYLYFVNKNDDSLWMFDTSL